MLSLATDSNIVTWPSERLAEALLAAAPTGICPPDSFQALKASDDRAIENLVDDISSQLGLEADQIYSSLEEVPRLLSGARHMLLRVQTPNGYGFLAIINGRTRSLKVAAPDGQRYRISISSVADALREPFEAPLLPQIDRTASALRLNERGRQQLIDDQLSEVRFRGCWLLHLPPGAAVLQGLSETHAPARILLFLLSYTGQYLFFIASWWALGLSLLNGAIDRGWIAAWLLMLVSSIPLRVMATWQQGRAAVALGAWLRRRLLRGIFNVERQTIRRQGVGRLFGLVVESAAVDSLALSGGLAALCASVELTVAAIIIGASTGRLLLLALLGWTAAATFLAGVYIARRNRWTSSRVTLSEQLLESMIGHRTRLVQQPEAERHLAEDASLDRYIAQSRAMDDASFWLTSIVPRGWVVVALAVLTPALSTTALSAVAAALGGILLAYRALSRLSAGFASLAGAVLAARTVTPLIRAASTDPAAGLAWAHASQGARQDASNVPGASALVREVTFRYEPNGRSILSRTSLAIERGARILLEGASGSGKTTLAAVLAGLERPTSGMVLVGGLDRAAVGGRRWRQRVIMAPQPHDNFLVGGSLAFNLLMGRRWPPERADLQDADALCRELGLGDLLDRLPAGMNQIVGENGWQLSQGERTRIFLARALLQHPELLILDESFSGLDWENVDRAMRSVSQRAQSVLAIAHP